MILELHTSDPWEKYHFLGVGRKKSNGVFTGAVRGLWIVPEEATFLYEMILLVCSWQVKATILSLFGISLCGCLQLFLSQDLEAMFELVVVLNHNKHGLVCIIEKCLFQRLELIWQVWDWLRFIPKMKSGSKIYHLSKAEDKLSSRTEARFLQ